MALAPTADASDRDAARCPICNDPIDQNPRGRRRKYCHNACRQIAYRRRNGQRRHRGLVRLVEQDARLWLPTLPDEHVDLIVTDPPYRFDRGNTYFRRWFAELDDDEWPVIFGQLYRVLRSNAHCYVFCDPRTEAIFAAAAERAGFRVMTPLVWDKGSIGLGGGGWRAQYEHIAFYTKGSRAGNYRNRSNVLRAPRRTRGHPTEKPTPLLEQLVAQSSNRDDLILDPFCGSGNVGAAARKISRRALLCDINTADACRRLRLAAPDRHKPATRRFVSSDSA